MILANVNSGVSEWALRFWPVVLISFVVGVVGTLVSRRAALKFGIVDRPDNIVKTHKKPTAYLGGIGILAGFLAGIIASLVLFGDDGVYGFPLKWLIGVSAGGAIACIVGLIDDLRNIRPLQKIIGQLCAAAAIVICGIRPFAAATGDGAGFGSTGALLISIPIVAVFVLGATNSLNLLDGIDGLCGSVTAVMAGGMFLLAVMFRSSTAGDAESSLVAVLALATVGSVCGFLIFNRHPATIFMGDAGSLLLGYIMASMMLVFATVGVKWCLCSVMIFGMPILDTSVAFLRRWLNKRPFFVSDRGHVYDQMMDRGLSLKNTVRVFCLGAAGFAAVGLFVSLLPFIYGLLVAVLAAAVLLVFVSLRGYLRMEGLRGVKGK